MQRILLIGLALLCASARASDPESPLHQRIDALMDASFAAGAGPLADDSAFLRRVHLDLVGVIPSADDLREFIADPSPDKRLRSIDRLLADPRHARHLAQAFDVMWMERRPDKHVTTALWRSFLLQAFQQNRPYNQLAHDVIAADGFEDDSRAAARFFLDRDAEPILMARDVGRMFFGVDLQCAQCHDHPLIDAYYQRDFYGLLAFVQRTYVHEDKERKKSYLAEKAEGVANFKSVFTDVEGRAPAKLPDATSLVDPWLAPDQAYVDPPGTGAPPRPAFSRRHLLADQALAGDSVFFRRNIVNRIWAKMMGRGLVEPVDLLHRDNPPSHPQVLDLLADEFARSGFDLRWLLRELAQTKAYQRELAPPDDLSSRAPQALAALQPAEQEHASLEVEHIALGQQAAQTRVELNDELEKARGELQQLDAALDAWRKSRAEWMDSNNKAVAAQQALQSRQSAGQSATAAAEQLKLAISALPDDELLRQTLQRLESRTTGLNQEAEKLQEDAGKLHTDAQAKVEALQQAAAAAEPQRAKAEQLSPSIARLEQQLVASDAAHLAAVARAAAAKHRLTQLQAITQWEAARAQWRELRQQAESIEAQQSQARGDLASQEQRMGEAQQLAAEHQAAVEHRTRQWEQHRAEAEHVAGVAELLALAQKSLRQAGACLPEDAEIVSAVSRLGSLHGARQTAAQVAASVMTQAEQDAQQMRNQLDSSQQQLAELQEGAAGLQQQLLQLQAQAEATGENAAAREAESRARQDEIIGNWEKRFAVAPLRPLSPEQLAMSMMQAANYLPRLAESARTEYESKNPLKEGEELTPELSQQRERAIEDLNQEKIAAQVDVFVRLFGSGAGQPQDEFFATVDQALFLTNNGTILNWLAPASGSLTHRLEQFEDAEPLARELYLNVLSREPQPEELQACQAFLQQNQDRKAAIRDLAWALMTSAEFRFAP